MLFSLFLSSTIYACAPGESPAIRKEWRELSDQERADYVNAVVCLHQKPSKMPQIKSPSRFDDVAFVHSAARKLAHGNPSFLPWHRAFLHTYETILKTDCGYKGTLPYWDWSLDSENPDVAFVWNPKTFGGDGQGPNKCVADGPFKQFSTTFGSQGCLMRDFGNRFSGLKSNFKTWSPEAINFILTSNEDYARFRPDLEFGPHGAMHNAVGGGMASLVLSANDPIFMLHHNNIDRTWARWQEMHPAVANTYDPNFDATEEVMNLQGLIDGSLNNMTVSQLFETAGNGALCYKYSTSVKPSSAPLTKRQVKTTLSCPSPVDESMLIQMYGQESVAPTRALESKVCNYIQQQVNKNAGYVSPATLVKPGVAFRSVPVDEYNRDVKTRSDMVKKFVNMILKQ